MPDDPCQLVAGSLPGSSGDLAAHTHRLDSCGNGRPVLVVEDDGDCREMMVTLLEGEGYRVLAAGNGAEALTLCREHRPSLVLLDLYMPVMDGRTFRLHQQREASIADIPVVCVSAAHEARAIAEHLGVGRCIAKPLDVDVLLDVVSSHCRLP